MSFSTCDLYDQFEAAAQVSEANWRDYGGRRRFSGRVATVRCFEDNSRIKELSGQLGEGRVLVVDGGASLRHALVGDMIAGDLAANGWAGVVIWGAVRDVEALAALDLGVKALGSTPRKSVRRGQGEAGAPVRFAGVEWRPGDRLYADADGVLLLPETAAPT